MFYILNTTRVDVALSYGETIKGAVFKKLDEIIRLDVLKMEHYDTQFKEWQWQCKDDNYNVREFDHLTEEQQQAYVELAKGKRNTHSHHLIWDCSVRCVLLLSCRNKFHSVKIY